MNKFKVGDLVYLSQGGPDMVVESTSGNNVNVVWFAPNKQSVCRDKFSAQILVLNGTRENLEPDLQIGDVVWLDNYNNPPMTVERILEDSVSVVWCTQNFCFGWDGPFKETFVKQTLVKSPYPRIKLGD